MSLIKINWTPDRKQLRTFGAVGTLVFGALALRVYLKGVALGFTFAPETAQTVTWVLAGLAAFCAVAALAFPAALRPLYIVLSVVSFPIGLVFSQVVLAAIFYLVFTPAGLIGRLAGWNPMKKGFARDAKSYWNRRTQQAQTRRYFRQY